MQAEIAGRIRQAAAPDPSPQPTKDESRKRLDIQRNDSAEKKHQNQKLR